MADPRKRLSINVAGEFFVDSTCIDCDTCRQLAPAVFAEGDDYAFVHTQPANATDRRIGATPEDIAVEEVELSDDENTWNITLGFNPPGSSIRRMSGEKIPRQFNEHTALRAFTSENIGEAGNPPKLSTGYGNAYIVGYKKLWGIK